MRSTALCAFVTFVGLGAFAGGCVMVDDERAPTRARGCALSTPGATSAAPPEVFVVDERGRPLCGARVIAREGVVERTAHLVPGECHHFVLPNVFGRYEVRVEKEGYQSFVSGKVLVGGGSDCDEPVRIDARLEPLACDGSAALSFTIDLRDELGGLVCDASVTVREGAFVQTLRPTLLGDACFWDGPAERPGTYEVTIAKPGYETIVLPSVVVASDPSGCHVVPAKVSAELVRSPVVCTDNIVQGLTVVVRDETGAAVCDATVTAREGDFEAVLGAADFGGGQCWWLGLPERPGVYEVSVTRPGYRPSVLEGVVVTADACHVKTVALDLGLTPEGP